MRILKPSSSLSISCSISLILIGIIVHIDSDKVDIKKSTKSSQLEKQETEQNLCNQYNSWNATGIVRSSELDDFFNQEEEFLSPVLNEKLVSVSSCINDKILEISPSKSIPSNETKKYGNIISKISGIKALVASFKDKPYQPKEIRFKLAITNEAV